MARDSINWVILLDNTIDMEKKDYPPNRFQVALRGVRDFIRMKCQQNPDAFISLYIYSTQTIVLADLTKSPSRLLRQIKSPKFLKQHPPTGSAGELYHTIQNAIEGLTARIQSIGGESYRILVIAGSLPGIPPDEFDQLLQKSQALKIHMDVLLLGSIHDPPEIENYRDLAVKTQGEFFLCKTKKDFFHVIKDYGSREKYHTDLPIIIPQIRQEHEAHLVDLARPLRRPSVEETERLNHKDSVVKCEICFDKKCPYNGTSLKLTGRYCPTCNKAFHLHCAGLWALKTKEVANLFRCPSCFSLLKLPPAIVSGISLQKINRSTSEKKGIEPVSVKMIRVNPNECEKDNRECLFCFLPIENTPSSDQKIFRCSNCTALYHVECLEKMYDQSGKCLNCDGNIA